MNEWCVFAYTALIGKTTLLMLQEVYDDFRSWALSSTAVWCDREINHVSVLGSQENIDEFLELF